MGKKTKNKKALQPFALRLTRFRADRVLGYIQHGCHILGPRDVVQFDDPFDPSRFEPWWRPQRGLVPAAGTHWG